MTSPKVTFALVPSSFATLGEYDKVEALLQAQGHRTHTIELLLANDDIQRPPASTSNDNTHIRSELLKILDADEPSNIVLALHSYSGVPGSNVLEGLSKHIREQFGKPTSVIGVLYIASVITEVSENVRKITAAWDAFPDLFFPEQYMAANRAEIAPIIYDELSDEEKIARYNALLVMHSTNTYTDEWMNSEWQIVPGTLIIPSENVIIPVELLEWLAAQTGKVKVVREDGSGHCINVSRPEVVVRELLALAFEQLRCVL